MYGRKDVIQELSGSTVTRTFVHGPGIDEYIAMKRPSGLSEAGTYYYHSDGLGSTTELTAMDGATLEAQYEYEPFGAATAVYDPGGIGAGGYGYTGRVNDAATGLMYYRSRYYSPEMRRFTQEDRWAGIREMPASFFNKSTYVNNSPTLFKDPSGLFMVGQIADALDQYAQQKAVEILFNGEVIYNPEIFREYNIGGGWAYDNPPGNLIPNGGTIYTEKRFYDWATNSIIPISCADQAGFLHESEHKVLGHINSPDPCIHIKQEREAHDSLTDKYSDVSYEDNECIFDMYDEWNYSLHLYEELNNEIYGCP